jgi:nucleotide-binding universal stress UspA family protein
MFHKEKKDYIVSLYDFTPEAEVALNHASLIAGQTGNEVQLLHIINNDTPSKLKKLGAQPERVFDELKKRAEKNQAETQVPTSFHAVEGSIFTKISEYTEELGAVLIVLGTHGVRGIQHVVGARSLRVILSATMPVIVVQKTKAHYHGYKKILVPIDYSRFGKNKIENAIAIASYFKSEVILFKSGEKDPYLAEIIKTNLSYATFLLKVDQIPYTLHEENIEEGSFSVQIIDLAAETNTDLIVISSEHTSLTLKDLFFGIHEIDIINNPGEIAVMCVNPLEEPNEDLEE